LEGRLLDSFISGRREEKSLSHSECSQPISKRKESKGEREMEMRVSRVQDGNAILGGVFIVRGGHSFGGLHELTRGLQKLRCSLQMGDSSFQMELTIAQGER
jgi:hypothetical protein